MAHLFKPLPYDAHALEPFMSAATLEVHHGKHYCGYIDKLNHDTAGTPLEGLPLETLCRTAEGTTFNTAAQAMNHELFFAQFSASPSPISARMEQVLVHGFGSVEALRKEFSAAAVSLFGSGWVWLSADTDGLLHITAEGNAGTPVRDGWHPLPCIDVWEHAYYLDYQNRRADFVAAFWPAIDWKVVESRYDAIDHPTIYY